jgi:DNA-binding Lrp family transcriptional regulator
MIAHETDVSPGTIRNRIQRLEEEGVIRGYHAHIDYSEIDGMLTALFQCDSSVSESETLAKRALDAPGVINVRELAPGRGNIQVQAVGADSKDLVRIAAALSDLGLEIDHENLIHQECFYPYHHSVPMRRVTNDTRD